MPNQAIKKAPQPRPPKQGASRITLNIRIKAEERGVIDRAAQAVGKTRTDFMLEAARRAAEDALAERTMFLVSPAAYAKFLERLDAPPNANDRLRRTLAKKAPWEES